MKSGLWGTSSVDVYLRADDHFRNMTHHLRPGDHVWFGGSIAGLGAGNSGPEPQIQVETMGCLQCKLGPMLVEPKLHQSLYLTIFSYLYTCFRFILNWLLNPIVIFK